MVVSIETKKQAAHDGRPFQRCGSEEEAVASREAAELVETCQEAKEYVFRIFFSFVNRLMGLMCVCVWVVSFRDGSK